MLLMLLRRRRLLFLQLQQLIRRIDYITYSNVHKLKKLLCIQARYTFHERPKLPKNIDYYNNDNWPISVYAGVTEDLFKELLSRLTPKLRLILKKMRRKLPPRFILLMTLSYLKSHDTLLKLAWDFKLPKKTCQKIIHKVLLAIVASKVTTNIC